MSFLRNHGKLAGVGATLGALSGYYSSSGAFLTPELWLAANTPQALEYILQKVFGYSDLAEAAPWWPRDTPVVWMLPLTAILVWLITVPCRPPATSSAAAAYATEQQTMEHLRTESAVVAVHHAELSTPSTKKFGKFEREVAAKAAQTAIVAQAAADVRAAQAGHAEYEAFLRESVLEWRLLRFEVACAYVLGWFATFLLGVGGFLAIPLVALLIPLALFVVLVSTNVFYEWTVHVLGKCGLCVPEEDEVVTQWGIALRDTEASEEQPGCCASMCASCAACCQALFPASAASKWGVQLRKVGSNMV